jgi:hypothetical protein
MAFTSDDNDLNEFLQEDVGPEEKPPKPPNPNRTFLVALGIIGVIFVIAVIVMGVIAAMVIPQQQQQQQQQANQIYAANTVTAMAATVQQATAFYLMTPSATLVPTGTPVPTATPLLALPTATATQPLSDLDAAHTATISAMLTEAAGGGLTPTALTGTPSAMPTTGFADEIGLPGLLIMAAVFVALIFFARRLRLSAR